MNREDELAARAAAIAEAEKAVTAAETAEERAAAEKELARVRRELRKAELQDTITEEQARAAEKAAREQWQADVLAAEKSWREAIAAYQHYDLEQKADAERKALDNAQWLEQQNFDVRLQQLQDYLESGHATAAGAKEMILDLLADFGIEAGDMGELLGKGWVAGIRAAIPEAVQAAKDLTEAFDSAKTIGKAKAKAERDLDIAKKRDEQRAAAAKKSGGSAPRGAKGAGGAPGNLVAVGKWLQSMGFQVGENPAFGGVSAVHTKGSYHYAGRAIDINWPGGGATELAKLQWAYNALKGKGVELLLEDAGESNQHLHFAMERGGIVPGWLLGDRGIAASQREAVLPLDSVHGKRILTDAFAEAIARAGGVRGGDGAGLFAGATIHVHSPEDIELLGYRVAAMVGA